MVATLLAAGRTVHCVFGGNSIMAGSVVLRYKTAIIDLYDPSLHDKQQQPTLPLLRFRFSWEEIFSAHRVYGENAEHADKSEAEHRHGGGAEEIHHNPTCSPRGKAACCQGKVCAWH